MDEVTCAGCGAAAHAGQKFCGECGAALAAVCVNGHPNTPGHKFRNHSSDTNLRAPYFAYSIDERGTPRGSNGGLTSNGRLWP